jgi:predicted 3-demethylubiquinone-9 3-methyltransferase (glyoxalase superfamily)
MPSITPNLWFDGTAEEAAAFYCSVFPNSRITTTTRYPSSAPGGARPGDVMTVEWELDGRRFVGINGGSQFTPNEAVSLMIECEDQDEIDHYWSRLTEGGGQEGPCGWLKDRWGFSWQVVPKGMEEAFSGDPERARRAFEAMLQMGKIDVAELQRAADGVAAA